jgi:nicotinamide-nucleotide amidase
MRAEIVAVGTELLLGQIVDTNSTWVAEELAAYGIDCFFQTRVGDNRDRIVDAFRIALDRADAVIVCGGLGPTQDDITREALAEVMGVALEQDEEARRLVVEVFARRNRSMPESNLRQAEVPVGAAIIPQVMGTAPGLICPVGERVLYALPGVPAEMQEMMVRAVLPDLQRRAGVLAVIASRTLRTWGLGEALLAETVAPRLEELDARGSGAPTIAFLASGIEGVKLRVTVKAPDATSAAALLDEEEAALRAILGDTIFGVDDETMEAAVGKLLVQLGLTIGLAESFTGGLMASRMVAVPGASKFFRGGVVAYDSEIKYSLLAVERGPVVSIEAAAAMASGVRELLGTDVALATTGVAGPDSQEGHPPGTAFVGLALPGEKAEGFELALLGSRTRMRENGVITALDALRRRLLALE